jgi:hypothetical protein
MAPERLDVISDSPAVDVYSAGMSMFELLTGRTMSLSINPVTHDQAMNRQLGYLQVPGISTQGLEDLRGVIRRMCAYDRDYRPTALDVSRDLEQCLYQIEEAQRVGLEEFAKTTVLPIYESRPKITPEDAAQSNSDDQFLAEVTGQLTGSNPTRTAGLISWTPYLFVGAVGLITLLAAGLAAGKMFVIGHVPTSAFFTSASGNGRVNVKVWIPTDAQAQIGDERLLTPGTAHVFPGNELMELTFDNGNVLTCHFEAKEGETVRYVVDQGKGGLSIDDKTSVACEDEGQVAAPDTTPPPPSGKPKPG